jgi:hypothetical protein
MLRLVNLTPVGQYVDDVPVALNTRWCVTRPGLTLYRYGRRLVGAVFCVRGRWTYLQSPTPSDGDTAHGRVCSGWVWRWDKWEGTTWRGWMVAAQWAASVDKLKELG